MLFDYAATRDPKDKNDKRCDLPTELRVDLKSRERNAYRVVAFTHLDDDHICGSSEFFYLEHADKYQSEDRIRIDELWVPAAAIIEEGCEDEARIIRAEARHRLKEGKGIRVFSRPEKLKDWMKEQGISYEERKHLITDAGQLVPGFSLNDDGVEFFVHSPFASRLDDGELLDRNTDALVMQATFVVNGKNTKLLLGSDVDYLALTDIVKITRAKKRDQRLEWDVLKLPHHCSYKSIGPKKGKDKTEPVEETQWLYEDQGLKGAIVVSPSKPIPTNDDDPQPPHRQAAKCHEDHTAARNGKFRVTMKHPTESAPKPLVIEIDATKARVVESFVAGAAAVISQSSPRVG